ncbi:CG13599 [Drosophila busckii]|uniref:CG13599 n=1 Tax=Drosophila busckii TaxID=30019 RepID=A0A0M4F7M1_DROBS|nr:CG13599 [Drosophila busckii]
MAQKPKNIELKLEDVDVLTTGMTAEFVNGILDFLLFQRSQIPFVYKTYKYYVEKWDEEDASKMKDDQDFKKYQFEKQRSIAKETKKAISDMREVIRNAFKRSESVKSLRFLFGNSTFMPTEAYTIHIPHASISKQHGDIHTSSVLGALNKALINLSICEDLYGCWSKDLKATKVFLEMELLTQGENQTVKLIPKDVVSQLPRSCKNIHFHLLHVNDNPAQELLCCKELTIFEDLESLTLSREENIDTPENITGWWQADVIVRGFTPSSFEMWSS